MYMCQAPRLYKFLFLIGVAFIAVSPSSVFAEGGLAAFDDTRFTEALEILFHYLEGSYGALLMACAGVVCLIAGAFGQYRLSIALLCVSLGGFVVRNFAATLFGVSDSAPRQEVRSEITAEMREGRLIIVGRANMPVLAWSSGLVSEVIKGEGKNAVVLTHDALGKKASETTIYRNLAELSVKEGDFVNQGRILGDLGAQKEPVLEVEFLEDERAVPVTKRIPSVELLDNGKINNPLIFDRKVIRIPPAPSAAPRKGGKKYK